ncbi:hypothetical protein [Pseudoalteromonas prydzensis]|uniref:hypothetical protein n=1 Tax=Pseudoalteromonas prydzensis TaxID=182141 RepID=UPI003FCFA697
MNVVAVVLLIPFVALLVSSLGWLKDKFGRAEGETIFIGFVALFCFAIVYSAYRFLKGVIRRENEAMKAIEDEKKKGAE